MVFFSFSTLVSYEEKPANNKKKAFHLVGRPSCGKYIIVNSVVWRS